MGTRFTWRDVAEAAKLLRTAARHPRWFADCLRALGAQAAGRHNRESFENALKMAARKHGVDHHRFDS